MKNLHNPILCGLFFLFATTLAANPEKNAAVLTNNKDIIHQWNALLSQKKELDQEVSEKINALRAQAEKAAPEDRQGIMLAFKQLQTQYIAKFETLFSKMRPLAAKLDYKANPESVSDAEKL